MKPIGIDLAALIKGQPLPADFVPPCPGARLRILRADYDDMVQGGDRFVSRREDIPYNAYGDARVYCVADVAELPTTAAKTRQFYGLCHSCSGLEADNRSKLRAREALKGGR